MNIKLFEEKKVRSQWDEEDQKWYFSIVDVVSILTDQPNHQAARNYWKAGFYKREMKRLQIVTS